MSNWEDTLGKTQDTQKRLSFGWPEERGAVERGLGLTATCATRLWKKRWCITQFLSLNIFIYSSCFLFIYLIVTWNVSVVYEVHTMHAIIICYSNFFEMVLTKYPGCCRWTSPHSSNVFLTKEPAECHSCSHGSSCCRLPHPGIHTLSFLFKMHAL